MLTPEEAVRYCLEEAKGTNDSKKVQKLLDICQMLLKLENYEKNSSIVTWRYWNNATPETVPCYKDNKDNISIGDGKFYCGTSGDITATGTPEGSIIHKDENMTIMADGPTACVGKVKE